MPNPPTAQVFAQAMDPADIIDFTLNLSQGDDPSATLQTGEAVASYTLVATAEAVAAGLQVMQDGGRAPTLIGTKLQFWVSIAVGLQASALFLAAGVQLAIELTIVTTSSPSRRRQRTILVQVAQQ